MARGIMTGGYAAYNFREKDPQLHELRSALEKEFGHGITSKDLKRIRLDGGPTVACTRGWWFGKTMSPRNASLESAGRSQGFRRKWVRDDEVKPSEAKLSRWHRDIGVADGKRKKNGKG